MRTINIAIFAGCFGVFSQASAGQLADCDRLVLGHDIGELDAIDLGAGHVAHRRWGSTPDLGYAETLIISNCASARFVKVATFATENALSPGMSDIRDEAYLTLMEAVDTPTSFDLSAIQAVFESRFEGRVENGALHEPSCGCVVAYPQLAEMAVYEETITQLEIFEDFEIDTSLLVQFYSSNTETAQ